MRKIYLVLFLFGLHIGCLSAQENNDQAAVLQLCVDLPELQEFWNYNINSERIINIRQYPVSFSPQIAENITDSEVFFYSMEEIKGMQISKFLAFRRFEVDNNNASVVINFFQEEDQAANSFKMLSLKIEMSKTGLLWNIDNLNMEEI